MTMKMMRVVGKHAEECNRGEAYGKYTPKETADCLVSTLVTVFEVSVEEMRESLSVVFQEKKVVNIRDEDGNSIVFRPDEMILVFRTTAGDTGLFMLTNEDIDAFFDGKPYKLSEFSDNEKLMAKMVGEIMERMMKSKMESFFGKLKNATAIKATNMRTEDINVADFPMPPIEVYAEKLKCPVEELLFAINDCIEKEEPTPIPNMRIGFVTPVEDGEHVRVVNGDEEIFGLIPLDQLYEVDENNEGCCPCPKCWRKRHENDTVDTIPVNRTLH